MLRKVSGVLPFRLLVRPDNVSYIIMIFMTRDGREYRYTLILLLVLSEDVVIMCRFLIKCVGELSPLINVQLFPLVLLWMAQILIVVRLLYLILYTTHYYDSYLFVDH